jgi:hypothetical protein
MAYCEQPFHYVHVKDFMNCSRLIYNSRGENAKHLWQQKIIMVSHQLQKKKMYHQRT